MAIKPQPHPVLISSAPVPISYAPVFAVTLKAGHSYLSGLGSNHEIGLAGRYLPGGFPHHIFMNTKYHKWFAQAALNPTHRRTAIAGFTRQRAIILCCAIVITACDLMICLTPAHNPSSPALLAFSAVMMWCIFFRIDSQRRVLTLLDQLEKDRDGKSAA